MNALLKFLTAHLISLVARIENVSNFTYCLKMRLDLKVHEKSLKEMKRIYLLPNRQGKFHFTKNNFFFTIFARTLPIFLRFIPNFTVSTEGYIEFPPHKTLEFFLTLVNG